MKEWIAPPPASQWATSGSANVIDEGIHPHHHLRSPVRFRAATLRLACLTPKLREKSIGAKGNPAHQAISAPEPLRCSGIPVPRGHQGELDVEQPLAFLREREISRTEAPADGKALDKRNQERCGIMCGKARMQSTSLMQLR